jgi:hypothetical protein
MGRNMWFKNSTNNKYLIIIRYQSGKEKVVGRGKSDINTYLDAKQHCDANRTYTYKYTDLHHSLLNNPDGVVIGHKGYSMDEYGEYPPYTVYMKLDT